MWGVSIYALFFVCVALVALVLSNVLFIPEHSDFIFPTSVVMGNWIFEPPPPPKMMCEELD